MVKHLRRPPDDMQRQDKGYEGLPERSCHIESVFPDSSTFTYSTAGVAEVGRLFSTSLT